MGINSTLERKDLYIKDYKMLIKETEEDTNIWGNSPYSQIERMNNASIYIISKVICSSSMYSVKILPQIYHGNRREK